MFSMAMTTYYLKARFPNAKAARTASREFTALIEESVQAETWWRGDIQRQMKKSFVRDFKQRFPRVFDYLRTVPFDRQSISHAMALGTPDDPPPTIEGKMLFYSAYVWHFANWSWLAKFVKQKWGALGVDWISEECVDPFDLLNP
jgi:hypothetical protein